MRAKAGKVEKALVSMCFINVYISTVGIGLDFSLQSQTPLQIEKEKGERQLTKGRMQNLHHSSCLGPFGKLSDAAIHASEAHEWKQENDSAEHRGPEEGRDEVIEDEVLAYERALRGRSTAVHWLGFAVFWLILLVSTR